MACHVTYHPYHHGALVFSAAMSCNYSYVAVTVHFITQGIAVNYVHGCRWIQISMMQHTVIWVLYMQMNLSLVVKCGDIGCTITSLHLVILTGDYFYN